MSLPEPSNVVRFPVPPLPRIVPTTQRQRQQLDARFANAASIAPRVPWDVFMRNHFHPKQGEHMGLIGTTGQGKTTMLMNVLPRWPYVAVFATKPRDESMDRLIRNGGYVKYGSWKSLSAEDNPRRVIWPDATRIDSDDKQKSVFHDAFARIYREGGWCIAIDELWYIIHQLGLAKDVRTILLQGRSMGISMIAATQRPFNVPLEVYDQSTHLMFSRDNDERNLSRISGLNSAVPSAYIREIVSNLEQFQFLYLNTRTGDMVRTRAPKIGG